MTESEALCTPIWTRLSRIRPLAPNRGHLFLYVRLYGHLRALYVRMDGDQAAVDSVRT